MSLSERLRIVHVSHFPTGLKKTSYSTPENKISNGLIRLGHQVLNVNERDIARAKSFLGHRKLGKKAANKALYDFCRQTRPHILLLSQAHMITTSILDRLRREQPSLRIGYWNGEYLNEWENFAQIRDIQPHVDMTFVTSYGGTSFDKLAQIGPLRFVGNPTDLCIETQRADQYAYPSYDLFIDTGNPLDKRVICKGKWRMYDLDQWLKRKIPTMCIKHIGTGPWVPHIIDVPYHELVGRSAIALNISKNTDIPLYSSDRIAKLAGNGALVAIERATQFDKLFTDDEMLFFSSLDELCEKLRFYIAHPEKRMEHARRGREKYQAYFNEKRVAHHMIQCLKTPHDAPYLLGTDFKI